MFQRNPLFFEYGDVLKIFNEKLNSSARELFNYLVSGFILLRSRYLRGPRFLCSAGRKPSPYSSRIILQQPAIGVAMMAPTRPNIYTPIVTDARTTRAGSWRLFD